ncbi:MAG: serine/threonine-protein kinase PknK, partial [Desulfobacterales bacterium]|nr:serine/threonine-protein kinase PknK [Desulfobacterales bacterium]
MRNSFRIIETIYQSRRTEVYRAIRESDGLPAVLKTRPESMSNESESGLLHEFELGKTLKGDRAVEYLTLEREGPRSILAARDDHMNSLESETPEGGFELSRFLHLAAEIAAAIEEMHAQGVIHKDVNPSNIITTPTLDAVKLIDLGLASRISEEFVGFEAPAAARGTLAYISPEQTGRVNKPVDSRTDLYSLGASLYRLITGKPPFDATDPGELIYAHIARTPTPVFEIRRDVPRAVSRVIEKLLEKSPDERYQTASGVKKDLLHLRKAAAEGRRIADFKPGRNEPAGKIVLPAKLYGREKEIARLLDCFRESGDAGRVVAVTGPAGVGKTALIRELYAPITTRKGFFLAGKFDQLNKGLAYTAFADALKDFVRQCDGRDKETREVWKTAVRTSAGDFGRVLTDIIPEFENLIGKQPAVARVAPLETLARRDAVFSDLVKDICAVGRPLVLFLDDLQWADSATLSLLETIIRGKPVNLTIILSYRDKEIFPAHPAALFLDNLNTKGIHLTNLQLNSLDEEAVNKWMGDILPGVGEAVGELAARVMTITRGNPFYIASFLHQIIEKKYIRREPDGAVSLDMDAAATIPADADVAAHLIKKIQGLNERDREFLTRASILGARFSLDNIGRFTGGKRGQYQDAIQALVNARLLIKRDESIMFAHDTVQQAARALLDEDTASALHLTAGQNIRAALHARGAADEYIEEYIHHFNAAADLITDAGQRLELARGNTLLGKRLKNNAAYHAAERAFAMAISFLPPTPFRTHHALAVDLYTEYGETLFLNLKYEEGETWFETVVAQSNSPLDSANAFIKQISHHAAHHNPEKAMRIALRALEALGVKLPGRFLKIAAARDLLKVKRLLINKTPGDLLDLPVTEDPLVLAQMEILFAAGTAAYIGYPDYLGIIILKMISISLTRNNCEMSAIGYLGYAMILCGLGDADAGYAYGKSALALMERHDSGRLITKAPYLFGFLVHHWKAPARDSAPFFETVIASGLENGDYEFASYAVVSLIELSFYFGESITSLLARYPERLQILEKFNKNQATYEARFWHQMLMTMNNPDGDGVSIRGEVIDEETLTPLIEKQRVFNTLGMFKIVKMQLAYLAGDLDTAMGARKRAMELLSSLTGSVFTPVCHFFSALTCIARYREREKSPFLLRDAKRSLKKLKKWGAGAPENYLYKAQLVEAELLSVKGRPREAHKLYQAA